MAWFRKKSAVPAAVTVERIAQSLESRGARHKLVESESDGEPGTLFLFVGDVPISITVRDGWMRVSGNRFDTPLTEERGAEALGWLNSYMSSTRFGTGVIDVDDRSGLYDLYYSAYFPVESGLYDDQLDEYITAGVNCVVDGVTSFCEHFQFPVDPD